MKEDNTDQSSSDLDELDFPKVPNASIKRNSCVRKIWKYKAPLTELEPASPDPLTILYQAELDTNDSLSISEKSLENGSNSRHSHSNDVSRDDVEEKNINKKNPISEKNSAIIESLLNNNIALKLNPPINQIVEKDYVKMQPGEISLSAGDDVCINASDKKRSYGIAEGTGAMGFFDSSCLKDNSSEFGKKYEIFQKATSTSIPTSYREKIRLADAQNDNILTNVIVSSSSKTGDRSNIIIPTIDEISVNIEEAISNHPEHKKLDLPTFHIVKIQNIAKIKDELDLNINDKVCVYASNKTTSIGYLQKTGQVGIFPNECILESSTLQEMNLTAKNLTENFEYSLAGRRIKSLRKWISTIELTQ